MLRIMFVDDEKLALVGDFDAVLSLSLLEKAAAIRDAQKATSEVHGDGEYVIIAPADATDEEQSTVRELLLSRYVTHEDLHTDEKRRNCELVSSEFVHFISALISSRLLRECRAAELSIRRQ